MKQFAAGTILTLMAAVPALMAGPGISTTSTISFTSNPASVGDSITVTATVSSADSSPIAGGTLVLRAVQDGSGNPLSCSTLGTTGAYVNLASSTNAWGTPPGPVTAAAYTGLPGSYGYGAHFIPNNGDTGSYHESKSPCVDLVVNSSICTGGFMIGASQGSGTDMPLAGSTWVGSFIITLSNCNPDPLSGANAQGGTSAWTTVGSILPDMGSVSVRKLTGGGNQILVWSTPSLAPGQIGHMTVNLSGKIKAGTPSGTELNINGGWSASATDTVSLSKLTAGYTSPIIITVQ
jgi:hypothetical protein